MATETSLREMENILKSEIKSINDGIIQSKKNSLQQIKEAKEKIIKVKKETKLRIKELNRQSRKDNRMMANIQKQLYKYNYNEKRKKQEDKISDDNQEPEAQ